MTQNLSSPLNRITVLDALRGFALLGIIVIHMIQHFAFGYVPTSTETLHFPIFDSATQWIGSNVVMGRFINIFAFLFGLSLFIQLDKAEKKGVDFRFRFAWRMVLLFAFGLLCHSFYSVEIISAYGLFGFFLVLISRVKTKYLILLFLFFLLGGPRVIQATKHNLTLSEQPQITQSNEKISVLVEEPVVVAIHLADPSFLRTAKYNYQNRLDSKLTYQFGFMGRGYLTFSLFVLGLIVGRIRFFEAMYENKSRIQTLFLGFAAATVLTSVAQVLLPEHDKRMFFMDKGLYLPISLFVSQALKDIYLVLSSGVIITGFVLLYESKRIRVYLEKLSAYGRVALTNYISQGFIGAILFSPWAFGFTFNAWGLTALVLLGFAIFTIQCAISKLWLKYYLYGPLEWLLRTGTYLRAQSWRRSIPV